MGIQELTGKQAPILNLYGLVGVSPVLPLLSGLVALMESHWRWMESHRMGGELFHPKPVLFPWFEFPWGFVVVAGSGAGGPPAKPAWPGEVAQGMGGLGGWDGGIGYPRELGTSWKNGMGGD